MPLSGFSRNIKIREGLAFLSDDRGGLHIVNISDPSNVTLLVICDQDGGISGREIICKSSGGNMNRAEVFGIDFKDNLIYATLGNLGLIVLDASVPTNLTFVFQDLNYALATDVTLTSPFALISNGGSGVKIYDISNPVNPKLVGIAATPGTAHETVVVGNIAYVASDIAGLQIVDLSQWQLQASPTSEDVGNYPLRLTATDELGGSSYIDFTVRVEGPPQLRGNICRNMLGLDSY